MNENKYVAYEYTEATVKRSMEAVYTDNCESFGWSLEGTATPVGKVDSITMTFKRDRKIPNKAELTRLQRQFDAHVCEILSLEQSKYMKASAVAYVLGVMGSAFMAGSVFAVVAHNIPLCIVLAVPAFLGWIAPYFCYRSISRKKTSELTPLIEKKYDELYEVCEKASCLLIG